MKDHDLPQVSDGLPVFLDGYIPLDTSQGYMPKDTSQPWTRMPKDRWSALVATANPVEGQMDCGPTHSKMVGMSLVDVSD